MNVPERRMNMQSIFLIVGNVTTNQLNTFICFAKEVVFVLSKISVVIRSPETTTVATNARVCDSEGGNRAPHQT